MLLKHNALTVQQKCCVPCLQSHLPLVLPQSSIQHPLICCKSSQIKITKYPQKFMTKRSISIKVIYNQALITCKINNHAKNCEFFMRKQAQQIHLWTEIKESHLNESESSSSMPWSNDGANIRISGAIHDDRRLSILI